MLQLCVDADCDFLCNSNLAEAFSSFSYAFDYCSACFCTIILGVNSWQIIFRITARSLWPVISQSTIHTHGLRMPFCTWQLHHHSMHQPLHEAYAIVQPAYSERRPYYQVVRH